MEWGKGNMTMTVATARPKDEQRLLHAVTYWWIDAYGCAEGRTG